MTLNKSELTIYLTSTCNLTCSHCYKGNGNHSLEPDDIFWILDNIKNKRTTLLGGEPFLYPYLKDCLEVFPQVTVATNGTLISDRNVGWLNGINGVQLSLEMGKEDTNLLRGKGVWEKVFDAKKLLVKEEIEHYIRVSFWEGNLAHLSEFNEINTPLVLFPRIDKPPLPPNLTSKLFEEVMKHDDWVLALPNFMQYLNKPGRCKAATERINVFFDGNLTPCNLDLDYRLGRIGDDPFSIQENIDTFVMANKTIPSDCVGCKNREICRGSCYAAHVSAGCPLKYNFTLNDFLVRYNLDGGDVKQQVGKMTKFMKKMLVC